MSKIRINDLARELEVKSKTILDTLPEVGVTEKKTHSSSLEDHEAAKVRAYLRGSGDGSSAASRASRPAPSSPDEIKTKIDLSHISKPGDVLKAIISKQTSAAPTQPTPPARPTAPPAEAKPPAPVARPAAPVPPPAPVTPPRIITPQSVRPPAPPSAPIAPPATIAPPAAPQAPAAPVAHASTPSPAPPQSAAPRPAAPTGQAA